MTGVILLIDGTTAIFLKSKDNQSSKKSEVVCCHLHGFTSRFNSVTAMCAKLVDKLGDQFAEKKDFNVGYYEGKQQSKILLVSKEDLDMMYNCKACDIILWCDGRETQPKRKKEKFN